MRNILAAGTLACLCATSFSPAIAQDTATPAEAPSASTVLAVVNGTEILLGHVILLRAQLPEEYLSAPDDVLYNGILEQIIDQVLLSASITEETLELRLSLENERRALRAALAIDDALGEAPSDAEFQAAYDKAYADLPEEPEFDASHILVETEDEAKELVTALDEGADFAELAKEKSIGPSGPEGGALGWFGLGQMVPEFETAVLEMEVGAISTPVQTQFGWHVLTLNDKRIRPVPTLEEVKTQLARQMQQDRVDGAIAALREGAQIEKMDEGFDPAAIRDLNLLRP
ncbi:MAG: peptidylprolyl isomerase [Paracoccaceae bacterium]